MLYFNIHFEGKFVDGLDKKKIYTSFDLHVKCFLFPSHFYLMI